MVATTSKRRGTWVRAADGFFYLDPWIESIVGLLRCEDGEATLIVPLTTHPDPHEAAAKFRRTTLVRFAPPLAHEWARHKALLGGKLVDAASADVILTGPLPASALLFAHSSRHTRPGVDAYVLDPRDGRV